MVPIVQLVRASDCGSECRGFESHWAPFKSLGFLQGFFVYIPPANHKKKKFLKEKEKCDESQLQTDVRHIYFRYLYRKTEPR